VGTTKSAMSLGLWYKTIFSGLAYATRIKSIQTKNIKLFVEIHWIVISANQICHQIGQAITAIANKATERYDWLKNVNPQSFRHLVKSQAMIPL
jgi:hypothetical protein